MNPPVAQRVPLTIQTHGHTRTDHYAWLRDKENPETIAYLEAENAYLKQSMSHLADLQETLYTEMRSRIQESDLEVPVFDSGYWYYSRTEEGKQYRVYCRKLGVLEASEEILLDLNALAEAQQLKFLQLGVFSVSQDQNLLAYGLNTDGGEKFTIYIKRLADQTILETIENAYYGFAWAADHRHCFFTRVDAAMRPYQIYRRELGNSLETLVFEELDEKCRVSVWLSKSRAFLHIYNGTITSSEIRYLASSDPLGKWQIFAPRVEKVEYSIVHLPNRGWLVQTNEDALNGKIMLVPQDNTTAQNTAREHWVDWLAHDPKRLISQIYPFDNHLVIWGREDFLHNSGFNP